MHSLSDALQAEALPVTPDRGTPRHGSPQAGCDANEKLLITSNTVVAGTSPDRQYELLSDRPHHAVKPVNLGCVMNVQQAREFRKTYAGKAGKFSA